MRSHRFLSTSQFCAVVNDAGPFLERIQFYNYGEAFIHRSTVPMIRFVKEKFPHIRIDSSTNGHFFFDEKRRQEIVDSGIDRLIFSVDGATQQSYSRYRKGGKLQRVLDAMGGIVAHRTKVGASGPHVMWRYILFEWNDSKKEMDEARRLARMLKIDSLCWHLSLPVPGASKKYQRGGRPTRKIWPEFFESGPWPNALHEKRTSATPSLLRARIKAKGPKKITAGQEFVWRVRAANVGDSIWLSTPRPTGGFVTLAGQLMDEKGRIWQNSDKRVQLEADVPPGRTACFEYRFRSPEQKGRYSLHFDMVSELVAWFRDLGSTPLTIPINVV